MRTFLSVVMIACCASALLAQQEGIQFTKQMPWSDALQQAKAEDKLIFVDAYAVWCGPCKMMDRNTFTDEAVGTFFNSNFINVKIDMEKGEGIELAQQYGVRAYPTFLFIDGDGKVAHRLVGYYEPAPFLEASRVATNPQLRLSAYEARYNAGERTPEFIAEALEVFQRAMHPRTEELIEVWLESSSDWSSPQAMMLLVQNLKSSDSRQFKYMVNNIRQFENAFGKGQVMNLVQNTIISEMLAQTGGTLPEMADIRKVFQAKLPAAIAEQYATHVSMILAQYEGDADQFAKAAVNYYKKYPSDDYNELNNIAWAFYESVSDKKMLAEALKWAEKSVKIKSLHYNNDTLAAVYYKLGKKKQALAAAENAIAIAKANDEDYSGTEELLLSIKAMK